MLISHCEFQKNTAVLLLNKNNLKTLRWRMITYLFHLIKKENLSVEFRSAAEVVIHWIPVNKNNSFFFLPFLSNLDFSLYLEVSFRLHETAFIQ